MFNEFHSGKPRGIRHHVGADPALENIILWPYTPIPTWVLMMIPEQAAEVLNPKTELKYLTGATFED